MALREDVFDGLAGDPRRFPSQYLYDARGAFLFEKICTTPEYYPTRTEIAILRRHLPEIADLVGPGALVIEPGSGSGQKTQHLLEALAEPAGYAPIDISCEQLELFANDLRAAYPTLEVLPVCADFTGDYEAPHCSSPARRRMIFFPGSTIGNFGPDEAITVLRGLADHLDDRGCALIGVDLKKDASILEPAYDDAQGYSREFALNILVRLNRELDATFRTDRFGYEAPYNASLGRIEMALVSRAGQTVLIDGEPVHFDHDERVVTEYSYKYDLREFAELCARAGLELVVSWTDPDRLFGVVYLERAGA